MLACKLGKLQVSYKNGQKTKGVGTRYVKKYIRGQLPLHVKSICRNHDSPAAKTRAPAYKYGNVKAKRVQGNGLA